MTPDEFKLFQSLYDALRNERAVNCSPLGHNETLDQLHTRRQTAQRRTNEAIDRIYCEWPPKLDKLSNSNRKRQ